MKVETLEQFQCLDWIKKHFYIDDLEIEIINQNTLQIKDVNGQNAFIHWDGAKIRSEELGL